MLRSAMLRTSKVAVLNQLSSRYMHTTMTILKAQPFAMPAMSPTMEKGGIVEWKYKVGDTFSAGDVLLEVETDKAQIDVEAQDDGKLAKIIIGKGVKDIPVGETIAYLADVEDDLSTLEISEDTSKKTTKKSSVKKESSPKRDPTVGTESKKILQTESKAPTSNGILQKANPEQTLLPSVCHLLAAKGMSKEEAFQKIKSSGKAGRLLKGDVLAYFGSIPEESVVRITKYLKGGEQLDLSNIELRKEQEKTSLPENKTDTSKKIKLKPEPVILAEQLTLKVPIHVTYEQLISSLDSFVDEAYHYTHKEPLANTNSDFYDSTFEDLITQSPSQSRFKVSYQLIPLNADLSYNEQEDIFDLLSGSKEKSPVQKPVESVSEYILNVEVHVNDKYCDSMGKSERFINYLKQLEFV